MQQIMIVLKPITKSLTQIILHDVGADCIFPSHCTAITKVDDGDRITENFSIRVSRMPPRDY